MARARVLSVTIHDCKVQTFRAGGKGGQNQNKRDTGVRVIHEPSGAVGESREQRSQLQNKQAAFRRMAESPKFRFWLAQTVNGAARAEKEVAEMMERTEDFVAEVKDGGKWVPM